MIGAPIMFTTLACIASLTLMTQSLKAVQSTLEMFHIWVFKLFQMVKSSSATRAVLLREYC